MEMDQKVQFAKWLWWCCQQRKEGLTTPNGPPLTTYKPGVSYYYNPQVVKSTPVVDDTAEPARVVGVVVVWVIARLCEKTLRKHCVRKSHAQRYCCAVLRSTRKT